MTEIGPNKGSGVALFNQQQFGFGARPLERESFSWRDKLLSTLNVPMLSIFLMVTGTRRLHGVPIYTLSPTHPLFLTVRVGESGSFLLAKQVHLLGGSEKNIECQHFDQGFECRRGYVGHSRDSH